MLKSADARRARADLGRVSAATRARPFMLLFPRAARLCGAASEILPPRVFENFSSGGVPIALIFFKRQREIKIFRLPRAGSAALRSLGKGSPALNESFQPPKRLGRGCGAGSAVVLRGLKISPIWSSSPLPYHYGSQPISRPRSRGRASSSWPSAAATMAVHGSPWRPPWPPWLPPWQPPWLIMAICHF